MAHLSRIFLVGPMGAGKSSIGKQLAKTLGLRFIDTDTEIEARTGADIPWIFDVEGEAGFRVRESQVLEDVTEQDNILLATGGGVVMSADNRRILASRGYVVYLYATIEEQAQRTNKDKRRPLLQNDDPVGTLTRLMEVRDPLYRDIADFVIETDGCSSRTVAQRLIRELEK